MKEIKDYLHLYLGCDVMIEKSCYYLIHNYSIGTGIHTLNIGFLNYLLSVKHLRVKFKPILRPLSDMTEEEKNQLTEIGREQDEIDFYSMAIETWADATRWALSKHFDLFGLIEAGLAIDKTHQLQEDNLSLKT